jgi:hypothetical protein
LLQYAHRSPWICCCGWQKGKGKCFHLIRETCLTEVADHTATAAASGEQQQTHNDGCIIVCVFDCFAPRLTPAQKVTHPTQPTFIYRCLEFEAFSL